MELRTSEERWRSLLNNPIFGVTFLDENQRFITTSRTFQSMVGYSDEELRQLTPLDISVPGEREKRKLLQPNATRQATTLRNDQTAAV
jgi:PAS domain S-box-containing protein